MNPGKGAGLGSYLSGFREVLSRGSAVACLACTVFLSASWQSILSYNSSFLRERFLVTPGFVSYVMMGTGGFFIAGSMLTGRLVDRFGLKRLAVASTLVTGLLLAPYMYMADLRVAVILSFTMCLVGGVAFASTGSLILEQVPRYRGSMMSINTAADNFGSALGAGLGGLLLLIFNYEKMGMALGSLAILSAITYQLLVRDPTRRT
jgi:predicted MFS family arabinose efflux permease